MALLYQSAYKYTYDRTGLAPSNKIIDEEHTVVAGKHDIPFVLNEGVFYTSSVSIVKENGEPMALDDFHFIGFEAEVTMETGITTGGAVVIDDTSYVGKLYTTYQVVGGPEGTASGMLRDLKAAIEEAIANPSITLAQIKGLPATYPPSKHRHYPSDLEDLDLLKTAFEDHTNALIESTPLGTSSRNFSERIDRVVRVIGYVSNRINQIELIKGSGSRLTALEQAIATDESNPDYIKADMVAASPAILGEWDTTKVSCIRGLYIFTGTDGSTESAEFGVNTNGVDSPAVNTFGDLRGNSELFFGDPICNVAAAHISGKLQITITTTVSGILKVKWHAVL